jgi:hypothetical protein
LQVFFVLGVHRLELAVECRGEKEWGYEELCETVKGSIERGGWDAIGYGLGARFRRCG